ncbi:MAG: chemotaxis protein CheC [Pseudomonadota bacterium]|nr:chemotaxis protein CheC [Pseudomonadota bacterium]
MKPMDLSDAQRDLLTELGNISISRAARQLSALLNEPIRFAAPRVDLCTADEAAQHLDTNDDKKSAAMACIYQRMSGELTGRIALLLPSHDSHLLFQNLLGRSAPLQGLDMHAFEHEALTEIGNILISSCISAMADMLQLRIDVSVPRFTETTAQDLFNDAVAEGPEQQALLIHARLSASRLELEGTILLILSAAAAEKVVFAVQAMILAAD